jgi:PqqD family protein of HPr-rel-A system
VPSPVSTPTLPINTRWWSAPGAALACREWNGEMVVFNQETGSTHLLDAFAGDVLRQLMACERGATVEELASALAHGQDAGEQQESEQAVTAVLAEFARLGVAHADAS